MSENLLELKHVKKYFPIRTSTLFSRKIYLHAVDDVTLDVKKNSSFGLVGESGCGKSTLSRAIMRLETLTSGTIQVCSKDIHQTSVREMKALYRAIQMIFQNPFYSLNPRMTVEKLIAEPMVIHRIEDHTYREARVKELLERVGLSVSSAKRYPHEFSGGQRQRIGIARALALKPQIIICDEPVSSLDVSIQAQILNLLNTLRQELGLTYVFISHNLSVVKYMSQRIGVMYLGTIVEIADSEVLYSAPQHPYTKMLLSAIPSLGKKRAVRDFPVGDVHGATGDGRGCAFASRCPYAQAICHNERPVLLPSDEGHLVACHLC